MSTTTRRAALTALASVSALALPPAAAMAAAASPNADAKIIALAAEIERLSALAKAIQAERVDPFSETFHEIMDRWNPGGMKVSYDQAFAYSREVGREAAIKEQTEVDQQAIRLWEQMMAIPAATQAGKIAKVRTLLTFVHTEEWRGAAVDLDWEIEHTRALLGEFAGMTEDELAAI